MHIPAPTASVLKADISLPMQKAFSENRNSPLWPITCLSLSRPERTVAFG
jgi:hypothetical protein